MADYSDYKECTDCVHYKLCLHQEKFLIEHNRKDLIRRYGFGLSEPEICCNFRDRSRFVELPPCKEGDSVYSICFCYGEEDTITEWTVVDIFLLSSKEEGNSIGIRLKDECIFIAISPCELGNRYFLTKEAAERALKECESNGEM